MSLRIAPRSLLLAGAAFALSACEFGPSAEPVETPQAPKVRKLYAPGAEPGAEPDPKPAAQAPSSDEQAALQAALLGKSDPEPEPEAKPAEPAPRRTRPARRKPRRRPQAAAADVKPLPLLEDPTPAGGLSDGAFQSAITDWSGMKRCLASNAARLQAASGALRVAFTISGDGQVKKSRVVETSNEVARAIAPCVERRARRIRFPAFASAADEIEKTAKFVF